MAVMSGRTGMCPAGGVVASRGLPVRNGKFNIGVPGVLALGVLFASHGI
jgi:hypothetical protein